jgi:hypothetical protein
VLAIFVAGAWITSAIDPVVQNWNFGGVERPQSLTGKIGISYTRNPVEGPGHLPQTVWRVTGLYSEAQVLVAPIQVVVTPLRTIAAMGSSNPPAPFQYEPGAPLVTSFREWGGFCLAREDGNQGESCGVVLVPHWSVIVPLLLLSTGLLVGRRRSNPQRGVVEGLETRLRKEIPRPCAMPQPSPRRRKLALMAACLSGVAVVGWVRSSATADRVRFLFGSSQILELASAKEGLAFRQSHLESDESFRAQFPQYRQLTGEAHKALTFRPLGSDLTEAELNMEFPVEDAGFEPILTAGAEMMEQGGPVFSGEIQQAGYEPEITDGTSGRDWEGVSVDWVGAYFSLSRNPVHVTVVVPYWIVVMALVLMTAVAWRRPAARVRIR